MYITMVFMVLKKKSITIVFMVLKKKSRKIEFEGVDFLGTFPFFLYQNSIVASVCDNDEFRIKKSWINCTFYYFALVLQEESQSQYLRLVLAPVNTKWPLMTKDYVALQDLFSAISQCERRPEAGTISHERLY